MEERGRETERMSFLRENLGFFELETAPVHILALTYENKHFRRGNVGHMCSGTIDPGNTYVGI